ncbi:MAG: transglycosylase SLT domain-containing protein [Sphingobacteriales bacterium]|nr:MAG: transglycosylase SLT domain-containing protein [Sphingobacteriales bacterium]
MTQLPIQILKPFKLSNQSIYWLIGIILLTNIITFVLIKSSKNLFSASLFQTSSESESEFYLIEEAKPYIEDVNKFERSVKKIAKNLNVPPEWLMALMYSESKFDAAAINKKSGAIGLIQWKPSEINRMDITVEQLLNLSHEDQLKLIEKYYKWVKNHSKPIDNLTSFYLGAFYPDALGEEYCYAIYRQGETGYKHYAPLDANKDGQITVKEIDERLKRLFPTAYMIEQTEPESVWARLGF